MRNHIVLVLLLLSTFNLSAQSLKRVKSYLDTLCAPGMHGRGATFKGDSIASSYLSAKFYELGLKSFGPDYFQTFSFDINTFPGTCTLFADRVKLKTGTDYILDPSSGGCKRKCKTVYLDTTIFTSEVARKKFISSKLKNKALVFTGSDKARLVNMPVEISKKIGEAACHIVLQDKLTASLSSEQSNIVLFTALKSAFASKPKIINFEVDAHLVKNYKSRNVIGFVEGKVSKDSIVIVSAHYDHLGRMGKAVYFPGANDNASGVSMLLELAHYYSQPENIPDYSIAFIAFAAEEAGLIGSHFYVKNPLFPLEKIKFLINLDLLGTGEDGIMVVNGAVLPEFYDKLVEINEELELLKAVKKRGQAANSDHFFFYKVGVPAIFIYTLGGIAAYHDIEDIPATLPFTEFEDVFMLLTEFITRL